MTAIVRFRSGYVATVVTPSVDELLRLWKSGPPRWVVVRERFPAQPLLPTEMEVTIDLHAVEAIRPARELRRVKVDVPPEPVPAPATRIRSWPWQAKR